MEKLLSYKTIRRRAAEDCSAAIQIDQDTSLEQLNPSAITQNANRDLVQGETMDYENENCLSIDPDLLICDHTNLDYSFSDCSTDHENSDDDTLELSDINESLKNWVLQSNTPLCHTNSLLAILKPYFPSLPKDARTLLQTPRTYNIEELSKGKFYHFGIRQGILKKLKNNDHRIENCELTIQINVDGLPLFKSTSECFWPILALVKEIDPDPFIVSLWTGKSKPADSNELMEKFVLEMQDIEVNGIMYEGQTFKVKIANFVCDAPARSFIKKTKGHTGYYACDFCMQHGIHYMHRVIFPEHDVQERNDAAFDEMHYLDTHQQGQSILGRLDIGLVTQFPHDYMHLVCLGVMKKLISLWLSGPLNIRIGRNMINAISDSVLHFKHFLPREFSRKGRSLIEFERWKATEFRTFLLYVGPVVLKGRLSMTFYTNFLMLFVGITILSNVKLCLKYCSFAKQILNIWATDVGNIYGQEAQIYNVHGVTHLASQCKLYGPLHNFCGFPFENYLQSIKRLVRKPNSPLEQVIRRLDEKTESQTSEKKKNTFCKKRHERGPLPEGLNCEQFEQIHLPNYMLSSKSPDNAVLVDHAVYIITNVLVHNHSRKILCQKFISSESFFEYPLDSCNLDIMSVSNLGNRLYMIDLEDINAKVVLLPYRQKYVSIPMLMQ